MAPAVVRRVSPLAKAILVSSLFIAIFSSPGYSL